MTAVTVHVGLLEGRIVEVATSKNDTVAQLKQAIASATNVPANVQRLVIRKPQLFNKCKVSPPLMTNVPFHTGFGLGFYLARFVS